MNFWRRRKIINLVLKFRHFRLAADFWFFVSRLIEPFERLRSGPAGSRRARNWGQTRTRDWELEICHNSARTLPELGQSSARTRPELGRWIESESARVWIRIEGSKSKRRRNFHCCSSKASTDWSASFLDENQGEVLTVDRVFVCLAGRKL